MTNHSWKYLFICAWLSLSHHIWICVSFLNYDSSLLNQQNFLSKKFGNIYFYLFSYTCANQTTQDSIEQTNKFLFSLQSSVCVFNTLKETTADNTEYFDILSYVETINTICCILMLNEIKMSSLYYSYKGSTLLLIDVCH